MGQKAKMQESPALGRGGKGASHSSSKGFKGKGVAGPGLSRTYRSVKPEPSFKGNSGARVVGGKKRETRDSLVRWEKKSEWGRRK